jgi:hypothetical protein
MKHASFTSRDVDSRTARKRDVAQLVEEGKPRATRRTKRRHVILFLSANPRDSNLLTLTEECAEIHRELMMTRDRARFRFESRWAITVDDLMRHLTELEPTVVHFSGHGCDGGGLVLQGELGRQQCVSARALAMMLEAAASRVRVVLLNACYSAAQAQELTANVDCVVSMEGAIGDESARAFATRFYSAIGNGRSIGNAVQHGVAALAAKLLPDELAPRCMTRPGVDAHDLILD